MGGPGRQIEGGGGIVGCIEGGGRLMERGSRVGRSSGRKEGGRDGRGGLRVTEVKRKGWTARCADITCGGPPRRLVEGGMAEGWGVHATRQSHRGCMDSLSAVVFLQ